MQTDSTRKLKQKDNSSEQGSDCPVITFYSYKGGVGRSMALANLAILLSRDYSLRVIVVDWDLEAPGLHRYFNISDNDVEDGVIDYLVRYKEYLRSSPALINETDLSLIPSLIQIRQTNGLVRLLAAGSQKDHSAYAKKVNNFDWNEFYKEWNGAQIIEFMRHQLKNEADFVLIDSRTGITDVGGVCTLQLPDMIVMVFAFNEQNVAGTEKVIRELSGNNLIFEKFGRRPEILLLPSRKDVSEIERLRRWEHEAAQRLDPYITSQRIKKSYPDLLTYIRKVAIPYVPHYAYGEDLAIESEKGIELVEPLKELAKLLTTRPEESEVQRLSDLVIEAQSQGNLDIALEHLLKILEIQQESVEQSGLISTLNNISQIYVTRGDYKNALYYLLQSLELYREVGDRRGESVVLGNLGSVYASLGDTRKALEVQEQALAIARELGDQASVAVKQNQIGNIYSQQGDYQRALELHQQAVKNNIEIGNRAGVALGLLQIGNLYYQQEDYHQSLKFFQQAVKTFDEIGDRSSAAQSLYQIGRLHEQREDYQEALMVFQQAGKIFDQIGDRSGMAQSFYKIGELYGQREHYEEALMFFQQARKIFDEIGDRSNVAQSLYQIGGLYLQQKSYKDALVPFEQALGIFDEIGDRSNVAQSLYQIGGLCLLQGAYEDALKSYQQALIILQEQGDRAGIGNILLRIGVLYWQVGQPENAVKPLIQSLSLFAGLEMTDEAKNTYSLLLTLQEHLGQTVFEGFVKSAGLTSEAEVVVLKALNENKAQDSTIHGSAVVAESIKDSFNVIEKSNIRVDLKEQLRQLVQAVNEMIQELPRENAEEVAEDMKILAEQATKERPNPRWYNVSIDGLNAAAQKLGEVGYPVVKLTKTVRSILSGNTL